MFGSSITRIAPYPMRLTFSSPSFMSELLQHAGEAERHLGHAPVVELLRCIGGAVVVRVAVVGGIGDHQRRIAVAAERPVVRACHAGHEGRRSERLGWKARVLPEERMRALYQA